MACIDMPGCHWTGVKGHTVRAGSAVNDFTKMSAQKNIVRDGRKIERLPERERERMSVCNIMYAPINLH